jgi:hypothetical protein
MSDKVDARSVNVRNCRNLIDETYQICGIVLSNFEEIAAGISCFPISCLIEIYDAIRIKVHHAVSLGNIRQAHVAIFDCAISPVSM